MRSTTLYVIGNGFDLYHGIPSTFKDFGEYLEKIDTDTFNLVNQYFSVDDSFWGEFESRLADFDTDTLIDDAEEFLVGYGAEDWSDSDHHGYQFKIDHVTTAVTQKMLNHFTGWLRELNIPDQQSYSGSLIKLDKNALFLNFNYTNTLQNLYGIPDNQILHIHGMVKDEKSKIILGHGREPDLNQDPYRHFSNPEDADTRIVEGFELIDRYFNETFKPTNQIIQRNQSFFLSLNNIETVKVLGHSLSEVDHEYFHGIIHAIKNSSVCWCVSYHKDKAQMSQKISDLGIGQCVKLFSL